MIDLVFILGYLSGMIISLIVDIICRFIEGDVFEDD